MIKCPADRFWKMRSSFPFISDPTNACTSRSFEGAAEPSGQTSPRGARRTARTPPPPPRTRPRVSNPARAALPSADLMGNIFAGCCGCCLPEDEETRLLREERDRAESSAARERAQSPRSSASTSSTAAREDAPRTRHRRRCASRAPRKTGARSNAYKTGTADEPKRPTAETEPASGDAGRAPDETREVLYRLAFSPRRFPLRRLSARGAAVETT